MAHIVHFIRDEDFASRYPENRLHLVAREVAERLHGIHDVLYALALRHVGSSSDYRHLTFLGSAAMDLSKALTEAGADCVAAAETADQVSLRREEAKDKASKPKPGRRRGEP